MSAAWHRRVRGLPPLAQARLQAGNALGPRCRRCSLSLGVEAVLAHALELQPDRADLVPEPVALAAQRGGLDGEPGGLALRRRDAGRLATHPPREEPGRRQSRREARPQPRTQCHRIHAGILLGR